MVETEKPQMMSQYGAYALHAKLARLHARMRVHARTHAHTNKENCFSAAKMICKNASMLRHTYAALVLPEQTNSSFFSYYRPRL